MISLAQAPWEAPAEKPAPQPSLQDQIVTFIASQGAFVLRQTVAKQFMLTNYRAQRVLQKLVADGRLQVQEKTKSQAARYGLPRPGL